MGEDCRSCRKWEEDIYWTHFQSIAFCQFLPSDFDRQLAIPSKFANNMRDKLPATITMKGPSGATWDIGLIANGETLVFKHGWGAFVEDNSLEKDDILIFRYNGESRFDVSIFDGVNKCEKEASYFFRRCGHAEIGTCQSKRNLKKSSVDVVCESPSNRSRKDEGLMPVQSSRLIQANGMMMEVDDDVERNHAKQSMKETEPSSTAEEGKFNLEARKDSVSTYNVQFAYNRRPITEEEKEKTLQMAHAASTKDNFIVVMRPSHVYKRFYMAIPAEWASTHLPHKIEYVTLHVKEKSHVKDDTWQAIFHPRGSGGGLTGGWKNFAIDNSLEEFDVCLFELVSEANDNITLDISIFRVVDEVTPLTRLASPPSRRGKKSGHLKRKLKSTSE